VLAEAARQPNAEEAILSLKVCDPACGSGHFLIAAAHRMARRLAAIRTGDEEPAPEATRTALRDVISHCIYGVDVNPMAVELCKVSLWMEALEPGKPLAFLEHRIQCGNSLLGTTPVLLAQGVSDEAFQLIEGDDKAVASALRRHNRAEREGQTTFAAIAESVVPYGSLADTLASLDAIDDTCIAGVHDKEERYMRLAASLEYRKARLAADAWCAAFVWKKIKDTPEPVTHDVFRRLLTEPERVPEATRAEITRLARQYNFFHWHLAFPDVFRVPTDGEELENEQTGWSGGFDVVLGNPPWERLKHDETEWFAQRAPEIAHARTTAERKKLIEQLPERNPALAAEFAQARRTFEGINLLVRDSARYLYGASGELNLAILFAETATTLVNRSGRVGLILPTTIVTDKSAQPLCQFWIKSHRLASVYDFENRAGIFSHIHRSYKFCLLTLVGENNAAERIDAVFYTAYDLKGFAKDCGYCGPPFRWDAERRFLLRCELDAAYFHLYSIARDDVDYIMETFPIVKRKDEASFVEYRTKRIILEVYDAMQRAFDTGELYRSLLDPPPADPALPTRGRRGES
jgi:hypothetical protein